MIVGCFSLGLLETLLIWVVIIIALIMVVRLVLPLITSSLGPPWQAWAAFLGALLNIVIGAIVIIALIIIVFDLLACLVGLPRLRP